MSGPGTKSLLRFITCGSVDDGKSTLIGRPFTIRASSSTTSSPPWSATRRSTVPPARNSTSPSSSMGSRPSASKAITIDVAYRFFSTDKRKFIVADTPGHEQYTRNMVTGASTAVARRAAGRREQGHPHADARPRRLVVAARHPPVVLAINKMDLVGFDERRFAEIVETFRAFAERLGVLHATAESRYRRRAATMSRTRASRCRGIAGPRCCRSWRMSRSRPIRRAAPSACRCSGSTAPISISAAMPA